MKMKERIWLDVGQNNKENGAEIIVGFFNRATRLRREFRKQATFMRGRLREQPETHAIRSPRLLRCRFTIDR